MLWKILGTGGAVVAAFGTRKLMETTWKGVMGSEPPTSPESPDTDWLEAVAWAALSGALLGLARMLATRQAAKTFQKFTGDLPKPLRADND